MPPWIQSAAPVYTFNRNTENYISALSEVVGPALEAVSGASHLVVYLIIKEKVVEVWCA